MRPIAKGPRDGAYRPVWGSAQIYGNLADTRHCSQFTDRRALGGERALTLLILFFLGLNLRALWHLKRLGNHPRGFH